MAVSRHRVTRNKRGNRRSHDALTARGRSTCPRCNSEKLPHHVCGNCGYYRGKSKIKAEGF